MVLNEVNVNILPNKTDRLRIGGHDNIVLKIDFQNRRTTSVWYFPLRVFLRIKPLPLMSLYVGQSCEYIFFLLFCRFGLELSKSRYLIVRTHIRSTILILLESNN